MVWSMEEEEAGDLTSLSWLHNLNIMASVPPTPPSSPRPQSLQATLGKRSPALRLTLNPNVAEEYRTSDKKPPFSYATLICMAMKANQNKMTLSAIYSWIKENFMFFRRADPSWQNSIRHNLSLNKCFVKVAREKNEPGKGGFWRLDLDRLEEGHRSRRARVSGGGSRKGGKNKMKGAVGGVEETIVQEEAMSLLGRDVMLSGPSVVVESVEPATVADTTSTDEELAAIVWGSSPPSWDDTQLELLHSLLDSL